MFVLMATKAQLSLAEGSQVITSGAQNVYRCRFTFDENWEGLQKTAVFQAGNIRCQVDLDRNGECQIPAAVLVRAHKTLFAGVWGSRNGEIVLPTVMTALGLIRKGAAAGVGSTAAPDSYNQLLESMRSTQAQVLALRNDAESGAFDGEAGLDGATPQIGANGNWFIGGVDTGKPARGPGGRAELTVGGMYALPAYLTEEYEAVKAAVQSRMGPDTATIGFITDTHINPEGVSMGSDLRTGVFNAFAALANLTKELPINLVVDGGDHPQVPSLANGQTKQMGIDCLRDIMKAMSAMDAPQMMLMGNHDGNYTGDGTGYGLSTQEFHTLCGRKFLTRDGRFVAGGEHSYFDDGVGKLRCIFLNSPDTTYRDAAASWLRNTALVNVPEGYSVMVFAHHGISYTTSTGNDAGIWYSVKRYLDIVEASGVDFIAWVGGHTHFDWHSYYKGMLVVSCMKAGLLSNRADYNGMTLTPTPGTATESAFTVITVDRAQKRLYCTRFGLGNDRTLECIEQAAPYTNWLPLAVDESGAVFNGTGYQDQMAIDNYGEIAASAESWISGYMPIQEGDVIRIKGYYNPLNMDDTFPYIAFYNEDKSLNRSLFLKAFLGLDGTSNYTSDGVWEEDFVSFTFSGGSSLFANAKWFRLARTQWYGDTRLTSIQNTIVTINEEIL